VTDEFIMDHAFRGQDPQRCGYAYREQGGAGWEAWTEQSFCNRPSSEHAVPGPSTGHLINTHPHDFVPNPESATSCDYRVSDSGSEDANDNGVWRICGYPEQAHAWAAEDRRKAARKWAGEVVRVADVAQYAREPLPDAARRGPVVTLVDAPLDPLGTLATVVGIYTGQVNRSKSEVTDEQRRAALADMQKTVLDGPLEAVQFTFLVEGVQRDITHQMVRNRFSFFAQESLRFAVAEDWAQEVPLPPGLAGLRDDDPRVSLWRKAMNQAEDAYAALLGAGLAAEEARKVLPHAMPTRIFWVCSLRTLLAEAGKRTCTQAQFEWRQIFAGVAKALRDHGQMRKLDARTDGVKDGWQYRAFADLMRPVCYQQGKCGFMAKFDRGCTIRARVDAFERAGVPSSEWGVRYTGPTGPGHDHASIPAIDPREWAADPTAARVVE